jgi:hypothetical protein
VVNHIPLVSVERMIIDLASDFTRFQLTNVLKEAAFRRVLDIPRINLELNRFGFVRSVDVVRQAINSYESGSAGTRSALEDRFIKRITVGKILLPDDAGVPIGAHEVDFVWAKHHLIVEVDGPGHLRPNSRKRDPEHWPPRVGLFPKGGNTLTRHAITRRGRVWQS